MTEIEAIVDGIKNNFLQFYCSKIWNDWQGGGKNDLLMEKASNRFEGRFCKALDDKKESFLSEQENIRKENTSNMWKGIIIGIIGAVLGGIALFFILKLF